MEMRSDFEARIYKNCFGDKAELRKALNALIAEAIDSAQSPPGPPNPPTAVPVLVRDLAALRRRVAELSAALNKLYVVREKSRGGLSYNRLADELDTQLEELGPPNALREYGERVARDAYEDAVRLVEVDKDIHVGTARGIWLDRAARYIEDMSNPAAIAERVLGQP
jgi:hypothetical protein